MQALLLILFMLLSPQKPEATALDRHTTAAFTALEQGDSDEARIEMKLMKLSERQSLMRPVCNIPPASE